MITRAMDRSCTWLALLYNIAYANQELIQLGKQCDNFDKFLSDYKAVEYLSYIKILVNTCSSWWKVQGLLQHDILTPLVERSDWENEVRVFSCQQTRARNVPCNNWSENAEEATSLNHKFTHNWDFWVRARYSIGRLIIFDWLVFDKVCSYKWTYLVIGSLCPRAYINIHHPSLNC